MSILWVKFLKCGYWIDLKCLAQRLVCAKNGINHHYNDVDADFDTAAAGGDDDYKGKRYPKPCVYVCFIR